MLGNDWALLPLWYAVFLLSVSLHEAAHAFVAWRGGDPTAYHEGQVSLNPLPHIRREPLGTIVIPLVSFLQLGWMIGWASAPYDPWWQDRHPRRAAAMAAAGPLANLSLAALAFAALKLGIAAGLWDLTYLPDGSIEYDRLVAPLPDAAAWLEGVGRLLSIALTLNAVLCVFNLMPLPPMDGAAVVAGLVEPARRSYAVLRANPMFGLAGLVFAWWAFGQLFGPLFRPVLRGLGFPL